MGVGRVVKEGCTVGLAKEGVNEGLWEGVMEGRNEGPDDGNGVGRRVGAVVGFNVGVLVVTAVGCNVDTPADAVDGKALGEFVVGGGSTHVPVAESRILPG
jgi:hypothetical protein